MSTPSDQMGFPGTADSQPLGALAPMFEQEQQDQKAAQGVALAGAENTKSQEQTLQNVKPPTTKGMLEPMPFLLALSAIGGAASGLHGRVMLGALAGMAKGAVQGHEMGVQDAMKTYEANWKKLSALFALQNQYYNELYEAYGKNAEGQMQAIEMVQKLTNDEFNQKLDLQKLGLSKHSLWLKKQALTAKLLAMDNTETYRNAQLALARSRLAQSNNQQQLTPQEKQLQNAIIDRLGGQKGTVGGFGGVPRMKAVLDSLLSQKGKSVNQIADEYVAGGMHGQVVQSAGTLLGRREAAIDAAMQAIVAPGGNLDRSIQFAKLAGIGNNKPFNWAQMKASEYANNPAMRQFVQSMGELRSDVAQSFARGNIGSEGSNQRALQAVPNVVTLQELEGMKTSIPALAKAALKGTVEAEKNLLQYGPGGSDELEGGGSMSNQKYQEGQTGTVGGQPVVYKNGQWVFQ